MKRGWVKGALCLKPPTLCTCVGLARTMYIRYIRCIYGISGRKMTEYTVIYGVMYGSGQPYTCGTILEDEASRWLMP